MTRDNLLAGALRRARTEGVEDPGNLPFLTEPAGATVGVLLIHGFTATPWEMRPLSGYLAARGIASLAVRLPGHGTTPEDLATRRWEEWLDEVLLGHEQLASRFSRVYAAGLSTGALLALMLTLQRRVAGVILLSPYLRLHHRLAPFAGWLRYIYPYQARRVEDEEASHYYSRRPLAGVHQIHRLLASVSPILEKITVPVLAIHGEGDQTIDLDSGRLLVDRLGSEVKVYERLGPEAPHVLTSQANPHRQTVFDLVGTFLEEMDQRCRRECRQ